MPKYIILIGLFFKISLFAQVPSVQTVKDNITAYAGSYPQERAYIQFDKPSYSAGETIWFKAYLMKGQEVSFLSRTFYVDFTDDAGSLLTHRVYPVWQASASGNFDVPTTYESNSIHIHAYTKWMLNFDSAFLYNRDIRIIPKPSQVAAAGTTPALIAAAQFFPEGGDLIAGIKSKVAFKANYQNGLPVNITGMVADSKGNIIDSIKTLHDGMGFLYIDALAGETYTAKWVDEQGVAYQTILPAVKPVGATIQINPGRLHTGYIIKRQDSALAELKQVHIVATMQQQVVYMAAISLEASPATGGNIPSAQFPSGIMQITLFDSNWVPLAERITFINNNDYDFKPSLRFDTLGTGKRGKNVMVIEVTDTILSNLSVSVTDAGVGIDSSEDIVSHLLVTGDLKGRVYHPGYYFANKGDSAAQYLDLVMLTNGWRRFKWDEVATGKLPAIKYQRDSSYLNFSGAIHGAKPKQIQDLGMMMAIVSPKGRDSLKQMLTLPLNNDGSFSQPGFVFFDTLKVYYQFPGGSKLPNKAEVTFNSGVVQQVPKAVLDKNNLSYVFTDTAGDYYSGRLAQEQARLQELLKATTLKAVTVTTRVKTKVEIMDQKYTSGMFTGGDAHSFDLVNDPLAVSSRNAPTYLLGKLPGLKVILLPGPPPSAIITWRGATTDVYIDEIKADMGEVMSLNINDIAYIKAFPPPFYGSFGGGPGGAIAIYTLRGDEEGAKSTGNGMQYKLVAGYTLPKEFYTPNYDTLSNASMQEDVRTTLYWNPLIITTPKNHIIRLPFFNNDVTHQFRVVLEGVSGEGKFARIEKLVN